jgi:rSAM/selenodomain-associated transferase 1
MTMQSPPSPTLLGVFAKHWAPGTVKTRLAAAIGPEAAAKIYQAFLVRTVERFGAAAETCVLAFSPPERREAFVFAESSGWRLWPQSSGDLGTRMKSFFAIAFASGAARVVLIGTDSPTLPQEIVQAAFEALRTKEVVLGPAADGGYCLIGAARNVPPIFDRIAWSTGVVFRETVARLEQAQIPFAVLPEWYDVDDESGLTRLTRELRSLAESDPAWRPLQERVTATTAAAIHQPHLKNSQTSNR